MCLDSSVDQDDGWTGAGAGPDHQAGEVVEDHAAGGADGAVVGVEAAHGLVGAQGPADLPFDQAEHEQGQADHADQGLDAPVVLQEDRGDRERALEVVVAALEDGLALVAQENLFGAGLLFGECSESVMCGGPD
ncbi:hypothetical protein GCM10009753_50520 [Streptantibioticus ferralitis]